MNLHIDRSDFTKRLKATAERLLKQLQDEAAHLQAEIEQAASVLEERPDRVSMLNADAAFVVDGELPGQQGWPSGAVWSLRLDLGNGRSFGPHGPPDELRLPPGRYRAIILFTKLPERPG